MTVDARVELSARLRSYVEAWGTLDPLAVTDCYRADAVHRGPFVTMLCPELSDATVRASEELADFVAKNRAAAGGAGYDHVVTWVLEDAGASAVE